MVIRDLYGDLLLLSIPERCSNSGLRKLVKRLKYVYRVGKETTTKRAGEPEKYTGIYRAGWGRSVRDNRPDGGRASDPCRDPNRRWVI